MIVNLIGNFRPTTGLHQDALILRGLLTLVHEKVVIRPVYHALPQCPEADYNIFIEVVNPALFSYARKNILIPNPEWYYKTWIPYLSMFDEIWVKTREAEHIFFNLVEGMNVSVKYIGWTSIDKVFAEKKNYHKAIVPVGKNIYRAPKQILKAYLEIKKSDIEFYNKLPVLHIPAHPKHIQIGFPDELKDKVIVLGELTDTQYSDLLHECGLLICTSASEGYGHAINEGMSAGCNLILSPIKPFYELTSKAHFLELHQNVQHPDCLGELIDVSTVSIITALKEYVNKDFKSKKELSQQIRKEYEERHEQFIKLFSGIIKADIVESEPYKLSMLPESELPDVSIVCITRNRKDFMPLLKYCYMIQSYPEDKLELVIVDDGESIEDQLIGVPNVKYVRCEQLTIGEKRNLGVQHAMYDTIVMMDDDDVYPNNSVLSRVAMMNMSPKKECTFCTTIPCYDIVKYSSFMNVPPITLPMSQRISEATLCFTRKFWEERPFSNIQIAEGDSFIHGREHKCREISPQDVIVSLVHPMNTSSRKLPEMKEPNGCHYGFNETLFAVVSELGEKLNNVGQKESDHA